MDFYLYCCLQHYMCCFILKRLICYLIDQSRKNIFQGQKKFLLNEKEKFLECINAIKITQNTPKKIKYFYYYNLAAYKYFINEKNEAKKIFDENIRKKTQKTLLEIMLDYEDKPQEKIAELKKLKSKDKLTEIQVKFVLAKTYEKVQDFEKAKKFYEEVAEKGNKLYIVKVAQKKILELNLKIKN